MTITFPIITLGDGEVADPQWFSDITDTANDHETRLNTLEQQQIQLVYKSSDETINNSATLQNDNDLFTSAEPDSFYDFRLWLIINSGTTPNWKMDWTVPTGAALTWSIQEGVPANLFAVLRGPYIAGASAAINGAGADQIVIVEGLLTTASTGGVLQLRWAQNTANASNTSVKTGSRLRLWKLV